MRLLLKFLPSRKESETIKIALDDLESKISSHVSIIISKVMCLLFPPYACKEWEKIVISIISRALVVKEVLNFMSALVEESDILGILFMSQLVTIQVLQ